jgi:hypothetical protein
LIELSARDNPNDINESDDQGHGKDKTKRYHYRHTRKNDKTKGPRDWRTRKDPFERVWDEVKLKLELNPEQTAKASLEGLIIKYPADFKSGHIRSLQRRVAHWRESQLDQETRLREIMQTNKARIL